jgi:cysteinyl-tRNA synthetase, unknown class
MIGSSRLLPLHAAVPARRAALKHVVSWGCQYQNVDLGAIAHSDLNLIAIDPSLDDSKRRLVSRSECLALKQRPNGRRRIILAYLSVGEVDVGRWFWPEAWRKVSPIWVGRQNPDWPDARHVRFWAPEWQDLIFSGNSSLLDFILEVGFDGVLLDRVDAYLDWGSERPTARDDMVRLVEALGRKARDRDPDFLLVPQNAEELLIRRDYLTLIDGHNKESLLTGLGGPEKPNRADDVDWSLRYLRLAAAAGVTMLATEYLSNPAKIEAARSKLMSLGFVPFFGTRALDRLPGLAVNNVLHRT